jgi:carbon storage regulator
MLLITRKTGQTVKIGDDITVFVTKTAKGRVQLGIEAPPEKKIKREEAQREQEHVPRHD